MNILLADDDRIPRLHLNAALTKLGHTVREVSNGSEAWAAWMEGDCHLVIADWMMPEIDGLEFCRRVRAEARPDYTYLVLFTARSGKANYLAGMAAGADDFITKPFERDEFPARIRVAERILTLYGNLRASNADLERRVYERTAQLEGALHAKTEFLSRASHELRTPMNHILGFAQLLESGPLEPKQARRLDQIFVSGARLMELIDRLLQISKPGHAEFGLPDRSKSARVPAAAELVAPSTQVAV